MFTLLPPPLLCLHKSGCNSRVLGIFQCTETDIIYGTQIRWKHIPQWWVVTTLPGTRFQVSNPISGFNMQCRKHMDKRTNGRTIFWVTEDWACKATQTWQAVKSRFRLLFFYFLFFPLDYFVRILICLTGSILHLVQIHTAFCLQELETGKGARTAKLSHIDAIKQDSTSQIKCPNSTLLVCEKKCNNFLLNHCSGKNNIWSFMNVFWL